MTDLTDYAESLGIRWLLTDEAADRPTSWEVALYTVTAGETGGGTEVSGNGYARQAVTFSEGGTGVAETDADLTFTSTGSWGNVVAVGVHRDGGQLLLYKALASPISVTTSGQSVIVDAGTMTARLA